jgi:hypothetical protein
MKKIKATAEVTLTLSRGAKLIEKFISDGENLGPHVKVGGKLFCPVLEWMVFVPATPGPHEEGDLKQYHGYQTCDEADYDRYFARAEAPLIGHDIKELGE